MSDMAEITVVSFKWNGDFIDLYGDKDAKDLLIRLPKWMFNQIVENMFDVKIADNDR